MKDEEAGRNGKAGGPLDRRLIYELLSVTALVAMFLTTLARALDWFAFAALAFVGLALLAIATKR